MTDYAPFLWALKGWRPVKTLTCDLSGDGRVTLTAYLHEPSPRMPDFAVRPAVLIFPGGGYHGQTDREKEPVAAAFVSQGYHAFVLCYSVGPEHCFEDALADADAALALIRRRAEEWDLDPRRIAVCGFSAGGHLAAATGILGRERADALILAYPCILAETSRILAFPVPSLDEAVTPQTPPAFLFHTRTDSCVPVENSLRFAQALARHAVPFEMHIFRNGPHGLTLGTRQTAGSHPEMVNPDTAKWFGLCITWLDAQFQTHSRDR